MKKLLLSLLTVSILDISLVFAVDCDYYLYDCNQSMEVGKTYCLAQDIDTRGTDVGWQGCFGSPPYGIFDGNSQTIYGDGLHYRPAFRFWSKGTTIRNLTIDGFGWGIYMQQADGSLIENVNILNSSMEGVFVDAGDDIEIKDVVVENVNRYGISIVSHYDYIDNIRLSNIHVSNTNWYDLYIHC